MAAPSNDLPFRLAGFVFYTRTSVLPTLLILVVWLADQFLLRVQMRLGMVLLLAHAIAESLLRGSRGSFVPALVSLMFLLILTRRLTRFRCVIIGAGVLASLILYPVFSVYRYVRAEMGLAHVFGSLAQSVELIYGTGGFLQTFSLTLRNVTFRLTGMGSLLVIVGSGSGPLGIAHAGQVTAFINQNIYRIPTGALTANAPSLVGWFYALGGNPAAFLGVAAFVLVVQCVWRALSRARLRSRVVGQTLFLGLLVPAAADGVLDGLYLPLLASLASLVVAEFLLRPPPGAPLPSRRPPVREPIPPLRLA